MLKKFDPSRQLAQMPSARRIGALLDELTDRKTVLGKARHWLHPELRPHCHQACVEGKTLTLFADSPAWAMRLRMVSPEVLRGLVDSGVTLDRCQVKVSPPLFGPRRPKEGGDPRVTDAAADHLEQAAAGIPDPELAACFRRIASRARSRSGTQG